LLLIFTDNQDATIGVWSDQRQIPIEFDGDLRVRLSVRKIHLKILAWFAVFIGGAVFLAFFWLEYPPAQMERAPSSVIYNDEGELVMVDMSIKDLEVDSVDEGSHEAGMNSRSSPRRSEVVLSAGKPKKLIFDRRQLAGLLGEDVGLRARRVIFHRVAFVRFMKGPARAVQFDLFDDVKLKVRFVPPSLYNTNAGLYSGSIDGDPGGRVRLFVAGESVQGTFETSTRTYRLIDAGTSQHFVIEER
jgi:hypothetical protein